MQYVMKAFVNGAMFSHYVGHIQSNVDSGEKSAVLNYLVVIQ